MKICLGCEGVTQAASARCNTCGGWLVPTDDVHYPTRRGEGEAGNPFLGAVVDGKYRLQAVLGRGGLGTVFQAQHVGSLVPVALKLLHPRFAEQREYRAALLNEARRAASVMHERCARLLDVGETEDGMAYLAMELVDGDTLEEVLRGGALPAGHVVAILQQVVEALTAIHGAGLVHCDLSPRNVMVVAHGGRLHVKVLDFGIARTISLGGHERTARGDLHGFFNPVFSAPEVLAGEPVDARADFYSLGMLAQLMTTGRLPGDRSRGDAAPPAPRGVPRRLARLVARCLAKAPASRPADARSVARELALVAGASRPTLARLSLAALGLVLVANLVGSGGPPPFLRSRTGSKLPVDEPDAALPTLHRRSADLDTVGLHFGGFAATDLRLEVSRGGSVLLRQALRPEVEAGGDSLVLSTAQPQWKDALEAIVRSSRDGAVDLAFVAPRFGPLAAARVRLDDSPPQVQWQLDGAADALTGGTHLAWRASDGVGLASMFVAVQVGDGEPRQLALTEEAGELALGEALAALLGPAVARSVAALAIDVVAIDPAGNRSAPAPRRFELVDLVAPAVEEVTGPGGEAFLPIVGGRARLRLRVQHAEPGCRLRIVRGDGAALFDTALDGAPPWFELEVPRVSPSGKLVDGPHTFEIVDAAGNRSERTFVLALREQDLDLRLAPVGDRPALPGDELVVGVAGATLELTSGREYRLVAAAFTGDGADGTQQVALERRGAQAPLLHVQPTRPGAGRLLLTFENAAGGAPVRHELPVRVLPAQTSVRVPETTSRFLPGLLQAGVLTQAAQGLREGPGWRIDPELSPYLRGTVWIGGDKLAPLNLPPRGTGGDSLLPEILPVPGHNVFALELRDVLGAPARVLVGEREGRPVPVGDTTAVVVADFWWHEGAPEVIGEVVLVEFGQPAVVRLRLPIAYREDEREQLRLGLVSEVAPTALTPDGEDRCIVRYDVPFATWSAAVGLSDVPRERYGDAIERSIGAHLATPLGGRDVRLRLRTTRSTLRALQLGELGALPAALAELTLLPVLAPEGAFVEPVPLVAPPRAMFRPQVAVAVRNFGDFLLQESEFTAGQARALLTLLPAVAAAEAPERFVHGADPLRGARLTRAHLLPATVAAAADDDPVTGVDFFQAYACCRVLGHVIGDDPDLFRLPLGCELELAAYGAARRPACHGVAANGGRIVATAFAQAAQRLQRGEPVGAELLRTSGDEVPTGFGAPFLGLDCGVREWVFDLPHVPGGELLLREWLGDHGVHLARCTSFARGVQPPPDLAVTLRAFGVVRGLALGELDGLLGPNGERLELGGLRHLPDSVPGVLRSEQLRRDGRDLLSERMDPRLGLVGFRLAGDEALVQRWRGRR